MSNFEDKILSISMLKDTVFSMEESTFASVLNQVTHYVFWSCKSQCRESMENVKPDQRTHLDFKKLFGQVFLNYIDRNLLHYRSGPWISILPMMKLQNLFFK